MLVSKLLPLGFKVYVHKKLTSNIFYIWLTAKKRLQKIYYRSFGEYIDWKNPKTLREKINWLKIYGDQSLWTLCADKYRVRDYVKERGLEDILVKLYAVYQTADEIDFDSLPNKFVIKPNHGSGDAIIVKDKSKINIDEVREKLKKYLAKRYGDAFFEPHYFKIKRCIVVEELLEDVSSHSLTDYLVDYKIWCFDGKPHSITVIQNRTSESYELSAFDTEWNRLDTINHNSHNLMPVQIMPQPKNLERMLEIASRLSQGFPEVRVDLYVVNDEIYFGEMTFTHNAGVSTWYTKEYEIELGNQLKLPTDNAMTNAIRNFIRSI